MLVIIASRRPCTCRLYAYSHAQQTLFYLPSAHALVDRQPGAYQKGRRGGNVQSSFPILLTRAHIKQLVCIRRLSKSKQPEKMFSSSKITALCLAVVALSNGAYAEKEAAQTFGLLGAGLHGGAGLYG
ncbi:hypothetical protein PC120_g27918, partial [Phytophthora cactorum]